MKRLGTWISLVAVLACAGARAQEPPAGDHDITLVVGAQRTIPAAGVEHYSTGVPGIVEVKVPEGNRQLVLTALKPGSTSLLLIGRGAEAETYRISVFTRAPQEVRSELKSLLAGLTGVDIRMVRGQVFLDGGVPAQEDLARIERIIALYPGQVVSLVTVDPARQRTNIRMDLHFVQLRKHTNHQFGVSWPDKIGGGNGNLLLQYDTLMNQTGLTGQINILQNLLPSLDILGARGWAKVNAVASVITTNGGVGTYHNGGEVNVRIATALGTSTLQKIPFGLQLTVQPRIDQTSDTIGVTIDAEQSQLAEGDPPGRAVTQTRTTVHVKLGGSIMLSGFKQNNALLEGKGIPWLMRIPLLGYLFRSERGVEEDVENVLFITPTVIDHTSPENAQRIDDALRRYPDFGGSVVY